MHSRVFIGVFWCWRWLATGVLCFVAAEGWAASLEEGQTALARWMEAAKKVKTVEAEFVQERLLSTVRVPLRRPGRLWMDHQTGLFRWQVGEPASMTVIRDADGRLKVFDGKAKTVRVWSREALMEEEKAGRGQGFAMLQSMQSPSLEDFDRRFEMKKAEPLAEDSQQWTFFLELKDRKAAVFVREIRMTMDVARGTLSRLVIVMRDKSSLATVVTNQKLNGKIPSGVFAGETDGYEVLNGR